MTVEYIIQSFTDESEVVCLRVTDGDPVAREAIFSGIYGEDTSVEELIEICTLQAEVDYEAGEYGLPWICPLEDEWWLLRTGRLRDAAPTRV